MMADLLSYTESVKFVTEQLLLDNCKTLLIAEDKYQLLCEITRRLHKHSPFHNFFLMAQEPEKRHKPNWAEIKSQMLSGAGGLCYPRNLFTFYLLRALGLDVIFVTADMLMYPDVKHLALIAQNVKKTGDKYLVDVGCGWPSFEPVDLSFEDETPESIQSHFRIKYIKENGKIIRLQRRTNDVSEAYRPLYEMCPDGCDLDKVVEYMDLTYKPQDIQLHHILCCAQYGDTGKAKMINRNLFTRETDDDNVEKFPLEDDDALVDCILENFPRINKSVVTKAVHNWRKECP